MNVNWKQVGIFLGLTFGLTWSLNLIMYLMGGLTNPSVMLMLQFQMLLPAFSALLLGTLFFPNSPIYFRRHHTTSRWFIYYYFLLTLSYLIGIIISLLRPELLITISGLLLLPSVLGLILLIVLRLVGGKDSFASVGLGGGKATLWAVLGLGLVAYYSFETGLNYVFKWGIVSDITSLSPQFAQSGLSPLVLILSTAFNALLIGPFLGLIIAFGEEYGWRGFLQSELSKLGRVRGTALLGTIWGIWHWPVIWMGYNYPGQPILGSLLMVIFCVELAFFLAFAVYKAKGVWIAAFLHGLNNQTISFLAIAILKPTNVMTSFGIGIPGLILGAFVVWLLLRDPLWQKQADN